MNITQEIKLIENQITLIEQRLTEVRGAIAGEVSHEDVSLDHLDAATYDNLHQFINNTCSAMCISGGAITASGANEIDVALGKGIIKIADNEIGANTQFDWAAEADIVVAADVTTWVGIEYNGGTPKVKTDTDISNFNFNTDFILGRVYNEGGTVLILNAGSYYSNFQHKVCYRIFETERFRRVSGGVILDKANLDFSISAGAWYCGTTRFTTALWDCSVASTFTAWYRDGIGGWTSVGAKVEIDNLNYDDGTPPLGALGVGRYGVFWVYLCHDGSVHVQYGQGDYKHFEAEEALVPVVPDFFYENCILVGKIVVGQAALALTSVLSAFEVVFPFQAASDFLALGDLTDVSSATPNDDDVLTWDAGGSIWQPEAGGSGGGGENPMSHRRVGRCYTTYDNYTYKSVPHWANYLYAYPFIVPVSQSFDRIIINVTAATPNGVCRLGIYEDDGDVYPGDLIISTAEIDTTGTGYKPEVIAETLTPGLYWLVINSDGDGTISITGMDVNATTTAGYFAIIGRPDTNFVGAGYTHWRLAEAYGALPNPFTGGAVALSTTDLGGIMLRRA